jgi:hypothetical protein
MKRFSARSSRRGKDGLSTADTLATLLLAAKEDENFRRHLEFILRLPAIQRESVVNTGLHEMEIRGEPAQARAAFAVLATEEGARIAMRALEIS